MTRHKLVSTVASGALALVAATGLTMATAPVANAANSSSCTYNIKDQDIWPTSNGVNLRNGPGTGHYAKGQLHSRDRLTALCGKGGGRWVYAKLDKRSRYGMRAGTHGWISGYYVNWQTCFPEDDRCPSNR
ncbi:SH3 domain-containing protein [Streptomyces sp. NPDC004647]|uniref:SH3 domain-containing protein n=1 Tax=Streptomyces sp. NPDC004647 TaxID=3154671 RepID=UPI0033B1B96C